MAGLLLLWRSTTGQDGYPTVEVSKATVEQYPYSYEAWLNLGSSFLEANDMARARYCYEVAHRLSFGNNQAQNNIAYLKRQLPNEVLELPGFFLNRWSNRIAGFYSPLVWMVLSLLSWVGIATVLYFLWIGNGSNRLLLRNSAIALGIICVLTLWFGYSRKHQLNNTSEAIINSSIDLRQSPDDNSESTMKLYAGFKVKRLDEIGDWTKVALVDKTQGWVPTDQLWIIDIERLP